MRWHGAGESCLDFLSNSEGALDVALPSFATIRDVLFIAARAHAAAELCDDLPTWTLPVVGSSASTCHLRGVGSQLCANARVHVTNGSTACGGAHVVAL